MTLRISLVASGMLALLAAPVAAQQVAAPAAAANATVGATVYDTAGGTVGTVESVTGGVVVIATGQHKVGLPLTSFAKGDKGPIIAMTRVQLDEVAAKAAADAAAALKAQIVAGAAIKDSKGGAVGTIKEAGADFAVVDTGGTQARLPLTAFAKGADGGLIIGMSKTELEAAAKATAPAPAQ